MSMSWKAEVGINNVPAFQVSGRPFASASVIYDTTARVVKFPYVTRWWQVVNRTGTLLRVGFSEAGVKGLGSPTVDAYYLTVPPSSSTGYGKTDIYEMKVSNLWVLGVTAGSCDVVAGLTTIPRQRTSGSLGLNFSGSGPVAVGV